jgi:MFS family permease
MALTAVMLCVLGLTHPGHVLFVAELGLVGVGLGLFTPANNAAIMGASPKESSGMASGVLNMTRGMGTAMGLAFTGLVVGLAGGVASSQVEVGRGFAAALLFLAALAAVAAVLSGLRGRSGDEVGVAGLVAVDPVTAPSVPPERPATASR